MGSQTIQSSRWRLEERLIVGNLKEKLIEKGAGFLTKKKSKKKLEKILPTPIAKQISKQVGKATEKITSKVIDLYNYFKK